MIKGFRQIAVLTAISRVFGLIRVASFFYFFGAGGLLDAFFIAFKIPNLSRRLFGEGAASASFIPVYTQELHTEPKKAAKLANTTLTVIFVLLVAIVLAAFVGIWAYLKFFNASSETTTILNLITVMLPYMITICLVAIIAGILNVHKHFASPAAAPIVLNIVIIGSLCIGGWVFKLQPSNLVFVVAGAVLLGGLIQLAIQIPPLRSSGISIRPAWDVRTEAFKKMLILMGPMIIGLTVTQINTLADDIIAWCFSSSIEKGDTFILLGRQIAYPLQRGCVSYLNGAQRLYQLPLGVLGISLATAIFPIMSADAAKKDYNALRKTFSLAIKAAFFVALPATIGLMLVAKPLVSVLFERGKFTAAHTDATSMTLLFYALGLCGFFTQQIVTRVFYSMQDSKTPVRSAMIAVAVNIILNLTLIWPMGTAGLALSTSLCSYLQVIIMIAVLRKRLGASILDGFTASIIKIIAATTACWLTGAGILILLSSLPETFRFDLLRLAAVVPSAIAAYILAAKLLRIEMLSLFTGTKNIPQPPEISN